jgi:hypothetical protein
MWCVMERTLTSSRAAHGSAQQQQNLQLQSLIRLLARQAAAEQVRSMATRPPNPV